MSEPPSIFVSPPADARSSSMRTYALFALLLVAIFGAATIALLRESSPFVSIENVYDEPPENALRVILFGNSHTYMHQVPRLISHMVPEGAQPLWFCARTSPGVTLDWHWVEGDARQYLEEPTWDAIVVQPNSIEMLTEKASFQRGLSRFEDAAAKQNTRLIVWTTFARDPDTDIYGIYARPWSGGTYDELSNRLVTGVRSVAKTSEVCPHRRDLANRAETATQLRSSRSGRRQSRHAPRRLPDKFGALQLPLRA